ncbi:hypothetical protein RRG08_046341 [Elysia crispata]|uniref:Uncharacterized protein n=1 Tax=Elysia crispata TaxID=231223 RepID=A0AAE1DSF0_9GAST|nr:hypothetical protein RRG08_046341 [Elysia crispata]
MGSRTRELRALWSGRATLTRSHTACSEKAGRGLALIGFCEVIDFSTSLSVSRYCSSVAFTGTFSAGD